MTGAGAYSFWPMGTEHMRRGPETLGRAPKTVATDPAGQARFSAVAWWRMWSSIKVEMV